MIKDFFKALGQLPDRRIRGVLVLSVFAALLALAVVWGLIAYLLFPILEFGTTYSWLPFMETIAETLIGIGLSVGLLFLFPPTMIAICGLLLDPVAKAVEEKHYPHLGPPRAIPAWETILETVKFAIVALSLNIVLLFFIFTGPLYLALYYLMNGYLIGREYFDVAAYRRHKPTEAMALRRRHLPAIWLAGAGFTFLLTIPVLNLIIPVLAVAYMVHYATRVGAEPQAALPDGASG